MRADAGGTAAMTRKSYRSGEAPEDVAHLVGREGPQRLGGDVARARELQERRRHGGVVRGIQHGDVVPAERPVDRIQADLQPLECPARCTDSFAVRTP